MGDRASGVETGERSVQDFPTMADRPGAGYSCLPSGHRSGSPADHQGPSVSRAPSFVSPFNRPPPLPADLVNSRFMASPEGSGLNAGLDMAKFGGDRYPGYKREHLIDAAYRGQLDAVYDNGRQTHSSLPMMPAYSNSRAESMYFGWPAEDVVGGSSYGRAALENSRINRSLSTVSHLDSHDLVRKHLAHPGDQYAMDRPLERSLAFTSRYGNLGGVSSSLPVNSTMETYPHGVDNVGGASVVRHGTDAAEERTGTPVSRTMPPPYSPMASGSSYIYGAPPSVHSFGCFSPSSFPPAVYGSYGSAMPHLPNYNLPNAPPPPPAHAGSLDASACRRSASSAEGRQSPEGFGDKPLDASLPHDPMSGTPQWSYPSSAGSRKESYTATFKGQIHQDSASDHGRRAGSFENQTSSSVMAGNTINSQLGRQSVSTEREQTMGSTCQAHQAPGGAQSKSGGYVQTDAYLMNREGEQMTSAAINNKSSTLSVTCHTQASMDSLVNALQQQPAQLGPRKDKGNAFPAYSKSKASFSSQSSVPQVAPEVKTHTPPTSQSPFLGNVGKPAIHFDDKKYKNCAQQTEQVMKPTSHQQHGSTKSRKPYQKKETGSRRSLSSVHQTPEMVKISNDGQPQSSLKNELQQYDSSTSEYEPPSPYQAIVRTGERRPKKKMTLRKKSVATSFAEDSEDSSKEEILQPAMQVTKTDKPAGVPRAKRPKAQKSKRTKRPRVNRVKTKTQAKRSKACPVCQKTFSRADSLTCHMRVHTGERPYHCDQCGATYKVSSHLRDHVRSKHSNSRPFGCEICGKTFTYSTARHRHEKICGKTLLERVEFQCPNCKKGFVTVKGFSKHQQKCGVTPADGGTKCTDLSFKCSTCEKTFGSFSGLDRHQRFICGKGLQIARYICRECGKVFQRRNLYLAHTRRHTGEKPFKCTQCDACFYDRSALRRHTDRHEGNRRFKCSMCDAAFYLKRCLSVHVMRAHCGMKPYKCNECDMDFASESNFSRHTRRIHRQERRFKCMLCAKGFFDSRSWYMHMRRHAHHPNRSARGETTKKHTCKLCNAAFFMKDLRTHIASEHPGVTVGEAIAKQMATCDLCSKEFSCRESLRVHRLRHTGEKRFQCDQCDMRFLLKCALVLHQRKHTDDRPHACSQCGKRFRWRASVSQHMLTHHSSKLGNLGDNDRKFTCQECGKHFKRQSCLNVHSKRHRQVMPCICSHCGKGFVDACRLKIHMSVHDGPKPFMCETCGAGFFYQYLLDDHIKRRHSQQPKGGWLCSECGKSLCRKDSFQKHMALHGKYQDGKIPKAGRRKGVKYPSNSLSPPLPDCSVTGELVTREVGTPQGCQNTAVYTSSASGVTGVTEGWPNTAVCTSSMTGATVTKETGAPQRWQNAADSKQSGALPGWQNAAVYTSNATSGTVTDGWQNTADITPSLTGATINKQGGTLQVWQNAADCTTSMSGGTVTKEGGTAQPQSWQTAAVFPGLHESVAKPLTDGEQSNKYETAAAVEVPKEKPGEDHMNLTASNDMQPSTGSMLFPSHDQNYPYQFNAYNYMHHRMPWYNGNQH